MPTPRGCALPEGRWRPVLLGPQQRVLVPTNTRYLNDHTFAQDDRGQWHVFGITSTTSGGFLAQRQYLHATAPALLGPWHEEADVLSLTADDAGRTSAPFLVRDGASWAMFWYWVVDRAPGLRIADSTDLFAWRRTPQVAPGGRDPFVMRLDDGRWALYTTWTTTEADGSIHDAVAVYTSRSLTDWSGATQAFALRSAEPCPPASNTCWGWYESPFIIEAGGAFYLFVTYTDSSASTYFRTRVFRSSDPLHFEPVPVAELNAHAGELVRDGDRLYLSSAGWPWIIGEDRRGLALAPVGWEREP